MKNRKNNLIKLGIFLFGISLLLFNCEKEVINTEQEVIDKSKYSVSEIGFSNVQNNTNLIQKLDELTKKKKKVHSKNTHSKSVYSSEYDFTVNTDFGKYLESKDGKYHSYTFPITRKINNGLLENLLVTLQLDGSYKLFLISYNITEKEKKEFLEGKYIDFKGKISYTKINTNLLSQLFSRESISCVDIYYTYCTEGNHPGGIVNGEACPAQATSMRSWCSYSDGGPATGGDDSNPSGDEEDHHNNEQGSGGTSPTNNDTNNDEDEEQIITVPTIEAEDCTDGRVLNTRTGKCECPDGKVEDSIGNCVDDEDCDTSKEDLKKVFPNMSDTNASTLASVINDKGKDFGIDSKEKLQHFLAQAGHEVGEFANGLSATESLYYTTES